MEKKKIFQGKNYSISKFNLVVNNKKIKQEIIEQKNAVAILAFEDDMIIMVKQFRFPCDFVLEIPAGVVDDGETALQCAKREFEEETGFNSNDIDIIENILPFEEIFTGSNFKTYKNRYYLAYTVKKLDNIDNYQQTEVSEERWVTFEESLQLIRPYNLEKKNIVNKINYVFNDINIVILKW